jgi:hypothetical protein
MFTQKGSEVEKGMPNNPPPVRIREGCNLGEMGGMLQVLRESQHAHGETTEELQGGPLRVPQAYPQQLAKND